MGLSEVSSKEELKKNLASFIDGHIASSKKSQTQSQACSSSSSNEDPLKGINEQKKETTLEGRDNLKSLLNKFNGLSFYEKVEVIPEELIDNMIFYIEDKLKTLEREVEERKEWAQQTAIQAATKLGKDITELNIMRMEKKEKKQEDEMCDRKYPDTSMKRINEMEIPMKKAGGELNRLIDTGKKFQRENAELRAEVKGLKLSAFESLTACSESAKREKKSLKKHKAWEKKKARLQEEIAAEREKISEMERQLVDLGVALREAEVKYEQERRAKDLALVQVQQEHRLKSEARANSKKRLQDLRQKTQLDSQRHKDDSQRLKGELSNLIKSSNGDTTMVTSEGSQREATGRMYPEFENLDVPVEGECLGCLKAEVSVLFMPCTHQVLCAKCNNNYEKMGGTACPSCLVPIERRISVFGAN